ncbi:DUF4249 domain-containing protein [Flavilitoribacter nigricans]|uniref:DUF4249 domain-containing protein n=1 Tax=Flavilitoribacter nigricans (strain ATCC 23147 / DSM 23189 / NBRC 102662 / NCIMB 1420 / SS-2) TaxID=1122177 RepID=A0A2D0NBX8_FLAN2|nr:DUF4249 domain-containing protein [Flavilitoribacter nigricans]PHN06011.1 hypothetical protein CRP01_13660 [Flavilitoribacter nigricans DSM 23189 = NBRC 102662]
MKIKIIFPVIAMLAVLTACQDVIELEVPDGDTLLVVDGWLTDQPGEKSVRLTSTANYFNNTATPPVQGALVLLYADDELADTLTEKTSGVYTTMAIGEVGVSYSLYIRTADGNEYVSLSELLRPVPEISQIYTEYKEESALFEEGYYVKIDTQEPEGKGDHYRWKQFLNDEYLNTPFDLLYASDELVDGNPILGLEVNVDPLAVGDHFRVQQLSISEAAYDFFTNLQDQTAFIGSLFDTPPSALHGNLENLDPAGKPVLGFFGVSAVSEREVTVE